MDSLGISDVDGVRQGVPEISSVDDIGDIGDGSGKGINVSGGGNINVSAGFSTSLSGVVASARVSPIVRVITEGDLSALGPISTSPPCSIRLCIAEQLRCDPEDVKAPLPLIPGETVLAFSGAVSITSRGVACNSLGTVFTRLIGRWLRRPFGSSSSPKGGKAGVRDTIACDPIPSAVNIHGVRILNNMRARRSNVAGRTELNPERRPLAYTGGDT